jgi:hypothetical protein
MSAPDAIPARRLRLHLDLLMVDPVTGRAVLRVDTWATGVETADIEMAALGVWPRLYFNEAEERAWLAGRGR